MTGWILALALARGFDTTTSCMAFAQGATERNPMLPASCGRMIGVQAGVTVIQGWALHGLASGHPKLAKVIGAVSISIEVGAGMHNLGGLR